MLNLDGHIVSDVRKLAMKCIDQLHRVPYPIKKVRIPERNMLPLARYALPHVRQHHVALHNPEHAVVNRHNRTMPAQMLAPSASLCRSHHAIPIARNHKVRIFSNRRQPRPIRHLKLQSEPMISLERLKFEVPDRAGLAPIAKYAHLVVPGDGYRVVGSTEASRGCKHLCRHCPIVPVYNGVFRIVERDVVLADVRQQVASGAQHISFGDPDFFNGIRHAMELVDAFHREFPDVTYDVTIKIEHLRKHEQHLARLRDTGCLFVISAVESVDDGILERLDKGHTREEFLYVARKVRELDMTLHPTFVPFTPWTTLDGYLDLLRVLAAAELIENVAPIQLGIRLLIPEGSRLLELEEVRRMVGAFDAESLVYPWGNADARVDALSETVQSIAAGSARRKTLGAWAFVWVWGAGQGGA